MPSPRPAEGLPQAGAACPTSEVLKSRIRARIAEWRARGAERSDSLLDLSGSWQFGLPKDPEAKQLETAHVFWEYYRGECDNCGGYVLGGHRNLPCGHIYCDLCQMRGRDDDCIDGLCGDDEESD